MHLMSGKAYESHERGARCFLTHPTITNARTISWTLGSITYSPTLTAPNVFHSVSPSFHARLRRRATARSILRRVRDRRLNVRATGFRHRDHVPEVRSFCRCVMAAMAPFPRSHPFGRQLMRSYPETWSLRGSAASALLGPYSAERGFLISRAGLRVWSSAIAAVRSRPPCRSHRGNRARR
jgi:hypothetical protein